MLTEYEAEKLKLDMRRELDAGAGIVVACCAGLLVVAGLALFGTVESQGNNGTGGHATAAVRFERHEHSSIAESRRLLEERRRAYRAILPSPVAHTAEESRAPRLEALDDVVLIRASD